MSLSVIIPAYKNTEAFYTNLAHNLQFLPNCEVIVVNDDPSESLKSYFEKNFPHVKLIEHSKNLGFGGAVNTGVNAASNPYVMLLNTDVVLIDDSYNNVFSYFQANPKLFAVSFAQKEKNDELVGKNTFYWKSGFFNHKKADDFSLGKNGWAEGGSCIIDTQKYRELGGFDMLYAPFYWEDIDLSYRAWKKGYEVLFDPTVVVEHHHESTIGKYFIPHKVKSIAYRNQFLFIWKNITNTKLILSHVTLLPKHLLYYTIKGEWSFLKGFMMAIMRLSMIERNASRISDTAIISAVMGGSREEAPERTAGD